MFWPFFVVKENDMDRLLAVREPRLSSSLNSYGIPEGGDLNLRGIASDPRVGHAPELQNGNYI